jgi:hypothetical protein
MLGAKAYRGFSVTSSPSATDEFTRILVGDVLLEIRCIIIF